MANAMLEQTLERAARDAPASTPSPVDERAPGWGAPTRPRPPVDHPTPGARPPEPPMTVGGVGSATGVLFAILLVAGVVGWGQVDPSPDAVRFPGWILPAILLGFGAAMLAMYKRRLARFIAPVYAVVQGLALGAISRAYEYAWDGIVVQAVLLTVCVFGTMLLLFASGAVRVTDQMRRVVVNATAGIMVFYLVSIGLSLFGVQMPLIWDAGPLGIGFSLLVAGLAAFNLLLDFDLTEKGVAAGLPKHTEWVCALSLMVSIVWLYLEILRLLAKLRN